MTPLQEAYESWWRYSGASDLRGAFMAGAAAMAEVFAAGQALRIEQAPRRYRVHMEYFADQMMGTKKTIVDEEVWAYSGKEAEVTLVRKSHASDGVVLSIWSEPVTESPASTESTTSKR